MSRADEQRAARAAGAAIFAEADVVASYYARPPYAPALFDRLLGQVSGRTRALDLGCGPGKVARVLAPHFAEVTAVDPSALMIAAGKAQDAGRCPNISWRAMRGEDFKSTEGFDLVTAASSIHWMDAEVLFPKLTHWTGVLAVLNNDPTFPQPPPPCGHDTWIDFLEAWFAKTGRAVPAAWRDAANPPESLAPHEAWMDDVRRERFSFSFRQSVEDFVASSHSRVSWPRSRMGRDLAGEFDSALDALMRRFSIDGMLELEIVSELTWGAPRETPRG